MEIRQSGNQSFEYFKGVSPFEMFVRQIPIPESKRWRLSMKLYPIHHEELGGYSRYLAVADVIRPEGKTVKITRYSTVFSIIPMAGGAMENSYIAKNDLSGQHYGCAFYKECSDLEEPIPNVGYRSREREAVLEKAPWEKELTLPAALIREMDYIFVDLKRGPSFQLDDKVERTWQWDIDNNIKKESNGRVYQVLTVDRIGDTYYLASRNNAKSAKGPKGSSLFRYHVGDTRVSDLKDMK